MAACSCPSPRNTFCSIRARQALLNKIIGALIGLAFFSRVMRPGVWRKQLSQPNLPTKKTRYESARSCCYFKLGYAIKEQRAVAGLTEKDLRLQDKDHATTGLYFKAGVDRVALLFALDLSGSVRDIISQQRDAALGLFARFSDRSSVAVMHLQKPQVW